VSVSADSWRCGFGHVGVCFQMRDIEPGMEVTCDYTLFEWDCSDKGIDACGCEQRPPPSSLTDLCRLRFSDDDIMV